MTSKLETLRNRFGELVTKPNKTEADIQEKERVRIALEIAYTQPVPGILTGGNFLGGAKHERCFNKCYGRKIFASRKKCCQCN